MAIWHISAIHKASGKWRDYDIGAETIQDALKIAEKTWNAKDFDILEVRWIDG